MSSSYDRDFDPQEGEVILSVTSPTGIVNELRGIPIGGYPLDYATGVTKVEYGGPPPFLIEDEVTVAHHGNGMYVWIDLNEAIETVKKWR